MSPDIFYDRRLRYPPIGVAQDQYSILRDLRNLTPLEAEELIRRLGGEVPVGQMAAAAGIGGPPPRAGEESPFAGRPTVDLTAAQAEALIGRLSGAEIPVRDMAAMAGVGPQRPQAPALAPFVPQLSVDPRRDLEEDLARGALRRDAAMRGDAAAIRREEREEAAQSALDALAAKARRFLAPVYEPPAPGARPTMDQMGSRTLSPGPGRERPTAPPGEMGALEALSTLGRDLVDLGPEGLYARRVGPEWAERLRNTPGELKEIFTGEEAMRSHARVGEQARRGLEQIKESFVRPLARVAGVPGALLPPPERPAARPARGLNGEEMPGSAARALGDEREELGGAARAVDAIQAQAPQGGLPEDPYRSEIERLELERALAEGLAGIGAGLSYSEGAFEAGLLPEQPRAEGLRRRIDMLMAEREGAVSALLEGEKRTLELGKVRMSIRNQFDDVAVVKELKNGLSQASRLREIARDISPENQVRWVQEAYNLARAAEGSGARLSNQDLNIARDLPQYWGVGDKLSRFFTGLPSEKWRQYAMEYTQAIERAMFRQLQKQAIDFSESAARSYGMPIEEVITVVAPDMFEVTP